MYDTEYGATSCQRRTRTRRVTTRNIRFPNQMIEQISIFLEQKKGPGISQPGSLKPAVETNVRRRAYTSIKVKE